MAVVETVAGTRLSLVAGLDCERPAVHVWDCEARRLRGVGTVGADSLVYDDDDDPGWERLQRTPAVAWHPDQPQLLVAAEGPVVRWTPAGLCDVDGLPPTAAYRVLAYSPDGQTLWAAPSSGDEDNPWESSDAVDLASGTIGAGPVGTRPYRTARPGPTSGARSG